MKGSGLTIHSEGENTMYKPKFFIFALICLVGAMSVFAQDDEKNQVEQSSYEVLLQVVVASNNPGGDKLPPALAGVAKKLKNDYSFSNYILAATFLERISLNGVVEHKGILNQLGQEQEKELYFTDWALGGLRPAQNSKGQPVIHFQNFRFGARVPIVVSVVKDAKGDSNRIINYESIGVSVNRFNLPENAPTIVGSMSTQKTDEFVFLVLTVKRAE